MSSFMRWCVVFVIVCGSASAHAEEFFFKPGDVVVMIGDSITEQHLYSNYVEMWTSTRFPKWKLTFRNVGIGGDTSGGGNSRFTRDVLVHKPTAMTVDFGMNDGRYRGFEEATFKPYMDGLQGMANQAKAANIRTAWVTPQPLDTDQQGPTALTAYNQTLEKFSEGVKSIADTNGGLFVDAGVLILRDPGQLARSHDAGSELVVEWRTLTVALLDRLAATIRERLNLDSHTLPLAKILEGGTWAAGRAIALEKRRDGTPPINVVSDGTVF